MSFGENLRLIRKSKKLTQRDLARIGKISLNTIVNYEKGHTVPKCKAQYEKLAEALGITLEEAYNLNAAAPIQTDSESHRGEDATAATEEAIQEIDQRKVVEQIEITTFAYIQQEDAFINEAYKKYGKLGGEQAKELMGNVRAMFLGGTASLQDRDAVMQIIQNLFWERKREISAEENPDI